MHLVVDAAVAHLNLKGAFVAPGVVPRVHAKPVVEAVLYAPADNFYGMAAECRACLVLVDTALVGQEVFVDSERTGHRPVSVDVLFNLIDFAEAKAIA